MDGEWSHGRALGPGAASLVCPGADVVVKMMEDKDPRLFYEEQEGLPEGEATLCPRKGEPVTAMGKKNECAGRIGIF